MQVFWIVVLSLLGALIVFMVIRALLTRPSPLPQTDYVPRKIDVDKVAAHLAGAVQIPTVTMPSNEMDGSIFYEYQSYLEKTYPLVFARAEKTLINKYAVIYKIKGSDASLLPAAILAHQDVVPAPPEGWEVPPFSGELKDGYVYGRGSQDMKSQMIVALEGLEILLAEGFQPKRSIYFCFGHDEELRGTEGADRISKYLAEHNEKLEFVIDEGGTVLDGKILGINNKIALIGTCEKGYADVKLEVTKAGGHASTPPKRTAVGMLSQAICEIENNPRKTRWTLPTKQMIKYLAPYMKFPFKLLFANRDILAPLLKWVLGVASPLTNGLVRTTMAATQTKGAHTPNTLPTKACGNINVRLNTGETAEEIRKEIACIVGKKVEVTLEPGYHDPSPVSDITSDAYKTLTRTIGEVFGGYVVAPYPFIAASDAKYYYNLTSNVYRFTPFEKTEDDANRIHAENERQSIESLEKGTLFFLRLYENACG
ncbi:MAG: M20/M25/M40 family metallo-hydrolase [Clostridia bacterium]|nr:M20/M25/M40 family metallo-hydrolase [Clostridia bacterium]